MGEMKGVTSVTGHDKTAWTVFLRARLGYVIKPADRHRICFRATGSHNHERKKDSRLRLLGLLILTHHPILGFSFVSLQGEASNELGLIAASLTR